jgi:hypothetical protein
MLKSLHVLVSSQPPWSSTGATICGVWIAAELSAVPEVRSSRVCGVTYVFGITNFYLYVVIFNALVYCVIPLCLIAFCYIMASRHLLKDSCAISEGTQKPQLNTRKITAKDLLGLIIAVLISCVPYNIWKKFSIFSITSEISGSTIKDKIDWSINFLYVDTIADILILINYCLNPVALFCNSLAFRKQFKRHLTCRCKTNSPPTDFQLTRRN